MHQIIVLLSLVLMLLLVSGCSGKQNQQEDLKMASLSEMPKEIREASVNVQQAYQFNIANPDIMQQIPCYCGCGAIGHTSNFNCYAKINSDGTLSYDGHALGCSICVDITLDTMRLLKQGKEISEIQEYVDNKYSRYGPPTAP
jgi:hypothetical protein